MAEETVENEESTEETDDSLRGMLESAFDTEESGGDGGEPEPTEAEGSTEEDAGGSPEPTAEGAGEQPNAGDGEAAGESKSEQAGPPIDWGPELREQWGSLPAPVQAKIAERERHIANAMQGTAQARQIAQEFQNMSQTYGSVMAAEGYKNPMQMAGALMQTATELRMGTPQQKADTMAQLINHFGIDIKTLDNALTKTISPNAQTEQQATDPNIEAIIDQRMAPVNQMMQNLAMMQQQKQQMTRAEAKQTVDEFAAKAEFLNDVRQDMADLIDLANKNGRDMPLQEAYDKACAMNPQIAAVMAKRAEQQKLTESANEVSKKRNAGASLSPGRQGNSAPTGGDSITAALNAAWDEQLGR